MADRLTALNILDKVMEEESQASPPASLAPVLMVAAYQTAEAFPQARAEEAVEDLPAAADHRGSSRHASVATTSATVCTW